MELLKKFRKLFLYAGVEKEEYHSLKQNILNENLTLLKVFSRIGVIMFSLLLIASQVYNGFANINSYTYLICTVVMLLIMICVKYIAPKHPALENVLVYFFEIVLYVFSIRISLLHAEKPAVSAVAFLFLCIGISCTCQHKYSGLSRKIFGVNCCPVIHSRSSLLLIKLI